MLLVIHEIQNARQARNEEDIRCGYNRDQILEISVPNADRTGHNHDHMDGPMGQQIAAEHVRVQQLHACDHHIGVDRHQSQIVDDEEAIANSPASNTKCYDIAPQ